MKQNWVNYTFYGLALGLLLAALQFFKYKWVLVQHTTEWYVGLVALIFSVVGIWAGIRFAGKKAPEAVPATVITRPSAEVAAQLGLTPRELDVLALIAEGYSNQEIADRLFVSLNTVKTHISNLLSKLDAERRTQAIQKAKTLGLIP